MRVTHEMDWGQTPGGKRYARCSCGWRAPVRSKLTHAMSDVRDHLSGIRRQCKEAGWAWWMVKGGLVTEEPDPSDLEELAGPGVSLPADVVPG